jgi:fibronectin type 3 domain-containing protein
LSIKLGTTDPADFKLGTTAVAKMYIGATEVYAAGGGPTAPGVPQSLSATRGNTQIALSWSAPSSDGGSALSGYKIYQSTDNSNFGSPIATQTATSLTVTSLTNGTTYYYKVLAYNAIGDGSLTASVNGVPATTPGVPQSLSATKGVAQVALSWSAPASNGGTAVTGYKVYQSTDNSNFGSPIATPSGTSHTVTSLTNGTQYFFKVAAVNAVGDGSQTSSVNATPSTIPAVPTSLAASAANNDTQIVLTWSAPTDTGGSAITGYRVKWGVTSGYPGNAAYINTGSTSATYTKTGLTNGTQYSFAVAAVNAVNASDNSGNYASAITATPATTPAAPTSVAGTNGDTQSVITWTAPTNTGGSAITGYKIKCGATSGYPGNATPYHQTNTTTTYTKTSLTNGTQYSIQIAAVNAEGDGTYSSTATATPAAASSGITPNTDSSARFYLPAAQTTFKVSCNTSTGYFKISSPGKTDVITQEHTATGQTYYINGGGASGVMSGLSSSAIKTVTVSSCTSGGTTSGTISGIDIGSDSTNNITSVDISGLTALSVFNAGATGGSPAVGKFTGGPVGTRSMVSSISEIRAVNVSFTSSNGYGTPYGPTTSYAYGGGFDLFNQDLDATALNQLYTDLNGGSGTGGVFVGQNPGVGSDNPSIASNYSIHGS